MPKSLFTITLMLFAVTEKHTQTGKNARFAYALSEMQGWRLSESCLFAIFTVTYHNPLSASFSGKCDFFPCIFLIS
jgi:hypothetical protein